MKVVLRLIDLLITYWHSIGRKKNFQTRERQTFLFSCWLNEYHELIIIKCLLFMTVYFINENIEWKKKKKKENFTLQSNRNWLINQSLCLTFEEKNQQKPVEEYLICNILLGSIRCECQVLNNFIIKFKLIKKLYFLIFWKPTEH